MSLLKAKRNNIKLKQGVTYFNNFKKYVDSYILAPTIEDFKGMIHSYGAFGVVYITEVAKSFEPIEGAKDKMVFMNSMIAEVANELSLAYFHKEEGYSIVDKVISYILDNGVPNDFNYIEDIIKAMNNEVID